MTAAEVTDAPGYGLSPRAKLEILFATLLALFLFALDQTVVGTALPRIITDLNGNELYTWSITIYLLTSTISGPIYGKLSDLFGRRPIFLFAVSLFLVGSVLCGLSQEMWQFVLFRGLQGLGGGAVFPVASPSWPTSTRRLSAASTPASSAPSSASRRLLVRRSAASSPTTSAGTGSSSSTCPLASSRCT